MIYLKKLSTGHDEDESHRQQLDELKEKIEHSTNAKAKKTTLLKNLREQKENYKKEQTDKRQ